MSDEANIRMARTAYAAWNRGDLAGVLDGLDPEIEWHMWSGFTRTGRVFQGHDGVREVYRSFDEGFEDFHTAPHEFLVIHGRVVVPVTLSGVPRGGGERVSFELVQVWTVREDRAVRLDVHPTLEQARAAIEAEGSPGGPAA